MTNLLFLATMQVERAAQLLPKPVGPKMLDRLNRTLRRLCPRRAPTASIPHPAAYHETLLAVAPGDTGAVGADFVSDGTQENDPGHPLSAGERCQQTVKRRG
jgi:hypothetical protein